MIDPSTVAANADRLRDRIVGAGGDLDRVRIMAVTKAFGADAVHAAHEAGLHLVGESYVQEYVAKLDHVDAAARRATEWHFIGRLQRNKVKQLPHDVAVIQSVDRLSLAEEVARRRPGQRILVQVNLGDEPQKGGCAASEVAQLVDAGRSLGLRVDGLMGVPEIGPDDVVTGQFDTLRRLADDLELAERSMGMTADLELAVASGSTMVRVGTALFGSRPQR